MRQIGYFLFAAVFNCFAGYGHVVSQFYAERKIDCLELLFDVGYALAADRDDAARPPVMREWLDAQTEEMHTNLRTEAETYLRSCLQFTSDSAILDQQFFFTDFSSQPREFLRVLNGVAYYRVTIIPISFGKAVKLSWLSNKQPDLVIKTADDTYISLKPGDAIEWSAAGAMGTTSHGESDGKSALRIAFVQGFYHVLPKGLDHVLFLAGMFLALGIGRNVLMQSLCFTAAHTVTLGLCAAGFVVASPRWVEPLIALSIALIALENMLRKKPEKRMRMVLIFAFGLVHGCGFAQVLSTWISGSENFILSLSCANGGVEVAQVCVLLFLWLVTRPIRKWHHFEKIRLGANAGLLLVGLFWTWERITSNG